MAALTCTVSWPSAFPWRLSPWLPMLPWQVCPGGRVWLSLRDEASSSVEWCTSASGPDTLRGDTHWEQKKQWHERDIKVDFIVSGRGKSRIINNIQVRLFCNSTIYYQEGIGYAYSNWYIEAQISIKTFHCIQNIVPLHGDISFFVYTVKDTVFFLKLLFSRGFYFREFRKSEPHKMSTFWLFKVFIVWKHRQNCEIKPSRISAPSPKLRK